MTRLIWQFVVGAWLCAGLGSGCALLGFGRPAPVKPGDRSATGDGQVTQARRLTGDRDEYALLPAGFGPLNPRSPYHEIFPTLYDGKLKPVLFSNKNVQILEPGSEEQEPHRSELPQPGPVPPKIGPPAPTPDIKPAQPEEPLVLALARLLKEDSEALKLLDSYDPATRRWFQRVLPLLAVLTRKGVEKLGPEEIAPMQDQLQGLLLELRTRAQLSIDKLCYCEPDLERSGSYKPLREDYPFLARCGNRPGEMVLLYAELRNLGCLQRGEFYEARISSYVEISDGAKKEPPFRKRVDDPRRPLRSRTLANDYFNTYGFYVPACIPPGRYTLTLEIRDETTDPPRVARSKPIPFVVAAEAAATE